MKHFHVFSGLWGAALLLWSFANSEMSAANMLVNPGFATDTSGWTLTTGVDRYGLGGAPDGDGAVLRFREDLTAVGGEIAASQKLSAAPQQQWTFSGWVLYPDTMWLHEGDYGVLDITFKTSSGGTGNAQSSKIDFNSPNRWLQLTVQAIAPANTTEVTFSAIFHRADTGATGRLYFDKFFAEGIPPIPEPHVIWAAIPVLLLAIVFRKRLVHV